MREVKKLKSTCGFSRYFAKSTVGLRKMFVIFFFFDKSTLFVPKLVPVFRFFLEFGNFELQDWEF